MPPHKALEALARMLERGQWSWSRLAMLDGGRLLAVGMLALHDRLAPYRQRERARKRDDETPTWDETTDVSAGSGRPSVEVKRP